MIIDSSDKLKLGCHHKYSQFYHTTYCASIIGNVATRHVFFVSGFRNKKSGLS
jgi:hypothetical protein